MTEPTFYQIEQGWMETYSGKQFFFMDPHPSTIDEVDIAHAIGKLCRYGGHTRKFYSVAEHCCRLAQYVAKLHPNDTQLAFEALMHDSTEGYLVDMPRPIKQQLPDYKVIEEKLARAIALRFGLRHPFPRLIHELDSRILVDERKQAMSKSKNNWGIDGLEGLGIHLQFWDPVEAPYKFLTYFKDLDSRRKAGMPCGDLKHG